MAVRGQRAVVSLIVTLSMALFLCLPAQALAQDKSQQPQSQQAKGATDIILTKTVEVYSYEDLTFSIDSYTIKPGDNIANILKSQGLWPQKPDQKRESQLLRLVSELNPVIANLDQISAGQTIYLPSASGLEEARALAQAALERQSLDPDNMETRNVAAYELNQPAQSPARVVVKRRLPTEAELAEGEYRLWPDGQPPAEPDSGLDPDESAAGQLPGVIPFVGQGQVPVNVSRNEPASEPAAPSRPAPAPTPPRASAQSSQNDGPLATASDGTVYRTVKVRKGDTLEKLLRREGLDRNLIYRHLIKLTVSLNPGLKNPNMISVGAELKIPASGAYLAGYGYEGAVAVAAAPAAKDQGQASPGKGGQDLAPAAGEKYLVPTNRLPSAPLPSLESANARAALGIVFTRLGEKIVSKGRLFLPLDDAPHFDIDTAVVPILELGNGGKIVLDFNGSIEAPLIKRFTDKYKEYSVYQPARNESMDKALERLLGMANYYRVYNKNQPFEGGRDVKLKISADWLVWPTIDSWNKGQPTIINLAPSADNGTPQVWVRFLSDHGIRVIDIFQGRIIGASGKSPTPVNNFTVIEVDQNPSAFAVAIIRSLGYSPRVGVKVDNERGRVVTGGAEADLGNFPPVFWETDKGRYILEYGELSTEDLAILRKNGFNIISSPKEFRPVLKSILDTEGLALGGNLTLNGNSTGGPPIELTIAGQSFKFNGRSYLFTPVSLPDNMTSLDPNQNVVVLHYRQGPVTVISNKPNASPGTQDSQAGEAPSGEAVPMTPESLTDGAATVTVEPEQ
jgi:hypothetical protein